jgi:hypothetical protein
MLKTVRLLAGRTNQIMVYFRNFTSYLLNNKAHLVMRYLFILFLIGFSFSDTIAQGTIKISVGSSKPGLSITYSYGSDILQNDASGKRWSKIIYPEIGDRVYVSAQTKSENSNVLIEIYQDGKVIKRAESGGDYVVASTSVIIAQSIMEIINMGKDEEPERIIVVGSILELKPGTKIYSQPSLLSDELGKSSNESVTVLEELKSGYYKIKSGNIEGFIKKDRVKNIIE